MKSRQQSEQKQKQAKQLFQNGLAYTRFGKLGYVFEQVYLFYSCIKQFSTILTIT